MLLKCAADRCRTENLFRYFYSWLYTTTTPLDKTDKLYYNNFEKPMRAKYSKEAGVKYVKY